MPLKGVVWVYSLITYSRSLFEFQYISFLWCIQISSRSTPAIYQLWHSCSTSPNAKAVAQDKWDIFARWGKPYFIFLLLKSILLKQYSCAPVLERRIKYFWLLLFK